MTTTLPLLLIARNAEQLAFTTWTRRAIVLLRGRRSGLPSQPSPTARGWPGRAGAGRSRLDGAGSTDGARPQQDLTIQTNGPRDATLDPHPHVVMIATSDSSGAIRELVALGRRFRPVHGSVARGAAEQTLQGYAKLLGCWRALTRGTAVCTARGRGRPGPRAGRARQHATTNHHQII